MKKFNEFINKNENKDQSINESLREDKKRLKDAVHDAEMDFWSSIADKYREVTTGDLDPGAAMELQMAMEKAVDMWLYWNDPSEDHGE